MSFETAYPQSLRSREKTLVADRRKVAGVSDAEPLCGVALSGGGIRSATFVLGFFQGLAQKTSGARPGLLRRIDVLSTVSGGGYFGAFLGALFSRQGAGIAEVEDALRDGFSPPIQWLRDNGRYLAPNGAGDRWLAGAIVLRNWAAVAVVMGTAVLTLLMGAHMARAIGSVDDRLGGLLVPWRGLYWSPALPLAGGVLLVLAVPFGWAYWLGRWSWTKRDYLWVWATTAIVFTGALTAVVVVGRSAYHYGPLLLAILAGQTLLWSVLLSANADVSGDDPTGNRVFRNRASRLMTACLVATAALLALGVVDTLGQSVYAWANGAFPYKTSSGIVAALMSLLAGVQQLTRRLDTGKPNRRIDLSVGLLSGVTALAVSVTLLVGLSALSHGIARNWVAPVSQGDDKTEIDVTLSLEQHIVVSQKPLSGLPRLPGLDASTTTYATIVLLVISFFLGRSLPFVNLSSLSQFYSARLSRTYIGASNQERQKGPGANLTAEVPGDDLAMADYRPHEHGGPLHLINVTLNETVGGKSQIEYRDRKGMAMAVGPAGISVGATHHALWNGQAGSTTHLVSLEDGPGQYRVWSRDARLAPKPLSLSQWTAISGAAVAPGMGARTSIGLSLLLAIGNVRLGYWWDSKVNPARQGGAVPKPSVWLQRLFTKAFPVQSALTQELLAQFHGPHQRYWFLSDGGHFENTGCYELLRRQIPVIVVCDDGADPDYGLEDLASLVRKARLDFGAEIRFLEPRPERPLFGSIADLRPEKPEKGAATADPAPSINLGIPLSRRHLLLGRVVYAAANGFAGDEPQTGRAESLLVVVKPSLTGDEPLDVLQYAAAHPTFPQEATADQFFDEAQWESYRKLGEHIGSQINALDLEALANAGV